MPTLRVDIWSDIACPWCYVGKRHLEAALAEFPHPVEVVWRSFELDPDSVRDPDESLVDRLRKKYGVPLAQAQAMIDRTTGVAAQDGLALRFDRVKPANTFDGHRLIHLARAHGLQDAMKERLLRAHLVDGEQLADRAVLVRLAAEVGLDAAATLASDAYADDVRADERLARELGVSGVPFFVMAGRLGVSGAQPVEVLRGALERAWAEQPAEVADGPACGPDGAC